MSNEVSAAGTPGGAPSRSLALGYGAAAIAVTIWAAWIVWTRGAVTGADGATLSAVDVGLLRYGAPALLLAPAWARFGLRDSVKPPETPWPVLIAMLGWGAPFVLLISAGMATARAAQVGALVPGTMPLWAALFGWLLLSERIEGGRRIGLALIGLGVALVIGPSLLGGTGPAALSGAPWLLGAAASWACFALAFKRSGLTPVRAAGLVAAYSTAIFIGLAAVFGTSLHTLPTETLLYHALTQGLLSGVVSVVTYTVAIARLGAPRAASLSALVPVLAALMAIPLLGEAIGLWDGLAILAASLGVAAVNGAFARRG